MMNATDEEPQPSTEGESAQCTHSAQFLEQCRIEWENLAKCAICPPSHQFFVTPFTPFHLNHNMLVATPGRPLQN